MESVETVERFIRINGYFCFFAGVGLNILLIWLVLKRSPKE